MIVMLMSLNVGAQEMEVFDGSYGYMVTNVVNGEKERCCYICLLYTSPSPRD